MRRLLVLAAVVASACASAPERGGPPPSRDRTDDPEFEAAREAARPQFETQADALAAGVYEPFVHPDSVRPADPRPGPRRIDPRAADPAPGGPATGAGDPSTEALLGTLSGETWYDRGRAPRDEAGPAGDDPGPVASPDGTPDAVDAAIGGDAPGGRWTLQLGAYTSETGALVRIRQLERDFPDLPRWHAETDGLWRVYLGRWVERERADVARRAIAARGYAETWVTRAP